MGFPRRMLPQWRAAEHPGPRVRDSLTKDRRRFKRNTVRLRSGCQFWPASTIKMVLFANHTQTGRELMDAIYLDNNAPTPLAPAVAEAMRPYHTAALGD